jgi:hypothetical protein
MNSTTLLQRPSVTVSDFRCSAVPGDKPFVEQHGCHSISFVRKGSFGYHSRGRSHDLVAGSFLIGTPGAEFVCSHDHVCGDECLSFFLSPELVDAVGARAEAWEVGATPPLAELMVLGELAQARQSHRAPPPPRRRSSTVAGRECASRDRAGRRRPPSRRQPVPFPAAVLWRARDHPASISAALAAAARRAAAGRR